jgi:hypothetical protein
VAGADRRDDAEIVDQLIRLAVALSKIRAVYIDTVATPAEPAHLQASSR